MASVGYPWRPSHRSEEAAVDAAGGAAVLRAHAGVASVHDARRIARAPPSFVASIDGALAALRAFRVRARESSGRRVLALVADAYNAAYESTSVALEQRVYLLAATLNACLRVVERELGTVDTASDRAALDRAALTTTTTTTVPRLVLILWHAPAGFTPSASLREQLAKCAHRATFEVFTRAELLVDIFVHVLQPPIIRLAPATSDDERAYLEREYDSLLRLERSDPVVRRLAAPPGAVLEYVRLSERTGRTSVYRRVTGASPAEVAAERARWRAATHQRAQ